MEIVTMACYAQPMNIPRFLAAPRHIITALAALLLIPYGLGAVSGRQSLAAAAAKPIPLTTTPLPLNRNDPGQTRIGALEYRGGVILRSTASGFGGISGLATNGKGQFLAITDTGNWLAFKTTERAGRLISVTNGLIAPLIGADGQAAATKPEGDAEALVWNPATGQATVSYEQDHRLVHYTGINPANPQSLTRPAQRAERWAGMVGWPSNGGAESLAHIPLSNGQTARLIIAEDSPQGAADNLGLLETGGQIRPIRIPAIPEHRPTDAEWLDGTRVLVLHRRFNQNGSGAALTLIDLAPTLNGDGPATSTELARWEAPVAIDNMEGLTITREAGQIMLYIISDDNLNSLQQTILLKFALTLP
jgi:hypothetical protein